MSRFARDIAALDRALAGKVGLRAGTPVRIDETHGTAAYRGLQGVIDQSVPLTKYYVNLADGRRVLVDQMDLRQIVRSPRAAQPTRVLKWSGGRKRASLGSITRYSAYGQRTSNRPATMYAVMRSFDGWRLSRMPWGHALLRDGIAMGLYPPLGAAKAAAAHHDRLYPDT